MRDTAQLVALLYEFEGRAYSEKQESEGKMIAAIIMKISTAALARA